MRAPRHEILNFVRSEDGRYRGKSRKFATCELAEPYAPRMIDMGAKYVLTAHNTSGILTLFTGLFHLGNGWYHGDLYDPEKALKRRLIIVKMTDKGFTLYLFNSYPKTPKGKILTLLK